MQVILMEKVVNLGQLGDVVKVKNGFARNFLIPQGKAKRATEANRKIFEEKRAELLPKEKEATRFLDAVAALRNERGALASHEHGAVGLAPEAALASLARPDGPRLLAKLGAQPVGMPVPQVPDALSKGTIDGAVIPYEVGPSIKIDELAKFTAEPDRNDHALYTALFVVPMNKAKYDSLPADLKAVIDKNSGREFSAFLGKTQAGNDVPGKEKMIKGGHTITVIEKAELENWKKASSSIDDEWIAEMNKKGFDGAALFKDAQTLIQKYTK